MKEFEALFGLLLSPSATIGLGFWMYFTVTNLKKEVRDLKDEIKELKGEIHDNGFLRKSDIDEKVKHADEVHERHDREIAALQLWQRELSNMLTRLTLKDR